LKKLRNSYRTLGVQTQFAPGAKSGLIKYNQKATFDIMMLMQQRRYLNLTWSSFYILFSATQFAPGAKWGLINITRKPHLTLWRWCNNGGTWTLLEAVFTSYFLQKVSWIIGKSFLAAVSSMLIQKELINLIAEHLQTPVNKVSNLNVSIASYATFWW